MNHLIVDGLNLAFSSFFAFSEARTSSGMPSGCIYGFLSRLSPWKKRFQDFHVTVAWDSGSVRKKQAYSLYKSERPAFTIGDQVSDVVEALKCLNVTQARCPGEEADDVIATLVKRISDGCPWPLGNPGTPPYQGKIYIFTGDKDMAQLVVDGKVVMIRPSSGDRAERFFDEEAVKAEFGVSPANVACFQAFRGDPIDSVPGLPRVRSAIIARLVEKYRTPEGVYAGLKDEKLTDFERKAFADFEKQAHVNWSLTRLSSDLQLEVTEGKTDAPRLATYLDKYEIKRIASEPYTTVFASDSPFKYRVDLPSLFE